MPTAISSPYSNFEDGSARSLAALPRGRVWIPAQDLPAALRALELLCGEQETSKAVQFPSEQDRI